jgi:hypothetical protein
MRFWNLEFFSSIFNNSINLKKRTAFLWDLRFSRWWVQKYVVLWRVKYLHSFILDLKLEVATCFEILVNKTNRCTEFQFYWYYYSTCFLQPFCPSSEVLSHTSALVHFMQFWWPFATSSRMELQFHHTPGSKMFITTAWNVPKLMYG